MSSRDQSRMPQGKSTSMYKMNKAANMRMQENLRRTAEALQPARKMSQVRVSRVSIASSRRSMKSGGGSLRSITSATSRRSRGETKTQRNTISSRKGQAIRRKRRRTNSKSLSSTKISDSEGISEMGPVLNESNDQFMASNYTYSAFSSEEAHDETRLISESDIFNKDVKGKIDVTEEGGWKFVEYLRSVKNSLFKEPVNSEAEKNTELQLAEEIKNTEISKQATSKTPGNENRKKVKKGLTSASKLNSLSIPRNDRKLKESNKKGLDAAHRNVVHAGPSPLKAQSNFNTSRSSIKKLGRKHSSQKLKSPSKQSIASKKSRRTHVASNEKQSKILRRSSISPSVSNRSLTRSVSLSRESSPQINLKESSQPIRKSALKTSKSQISVASTGSQASMSPEKKMRRVSILASLGSLEDMASSIAQLERENKLEAIRRLEAVAMEKRRQLAETRLKMRASLEEEIKINKKLESILTKIKLVRQAGEEAASIFDKQTQVFSTRKPD